MNERQKRSEKMVSLFIMFFLMLVFIAFGLNELVINNVTAEEYLGELKITQKGVQEIQEHQDFRKISYEWRYNNQVQEITLILFEKSYNKYFVKERIPSRDWTYYSGSWFNETDEVEILANQLIYLAEEKGLKGEDKIEFFLSFVQSLPSIDDTDDYPKFPYETLYEVGGDCEDLSILLEKILDVANINAAIIEFDNHVGVGVSGTGVGAYYSYNNKTYFYMETTSPQYKIGELPPEFASETVKIYEKGLNNLIFPKYNLSLITTENKSYYIVSIELRNFGSEVSKTNFSSSIETDTGVEERFFREVTVHPRETIEFQYKFPIINQHHRIRFNIKGREINDISLKTKWI